eukprot:9468676-Pyramimonas_sp.AAC.1
MGADVTLVEKRPYVTRNNVLHLWPTTVQEVRAHLSNSDPTSCLCYVTRLEPHANPPNATPRVNSPGDWEKSRIGPNHAIELGLKFFYKKFCAGGMDHISIRRMQVILAKLFVILGGRMLLGVAFEGFAPPADSKQK